MKTDKIHQGLLDIKQYIKNAGSEHKALMSQAERTIKTVESLLGDKATTMDGHTTAQLKKLARLFLEIENGLNKELETYSQDVRHIVSEGGALQKLGGLFSGLYLDPLTQNGMQLKAYIRRIEDGDLRKALNRHFRVLRENAIIDAIQTRAVRWDEPISHNPKAPLGSGLDERIVEFPLAFEAAGFDKPGKILDAGAALNLPYIRKLMGTPQARIVHFTQSGDKEMCEFAHDRHAYLFGDLRQTDFRDSTFDCVLCISTLEHIGMDNSRYGENETAQAKPESRSRTSYLDAVREMLRLVSSGGRLVITVPYGEAKDYGWYQVFDRSMVKNILSLCAGHNVLEKYYDYNNGWQEGTCSSFRNCPPSEDDVGSVCGLLITKNKTAV